MPLLGRWRHCVRNHSASRAPSGPAGRPPRIGQPIRQSATGASEPGSGPECRRSPGSACWCSFAAVETSDWSPSAAEAQCRHAQIPAALRPLCVRGRTWQQNPRRARIGMIGASASARSCRCERVPSAHSYAEVSIFIRDQQCCDRYVAEHWYPPFGLARSPSRSWRELGRSWRSPHPDQPALGTL